MNTIRNNRRTILGIMLIVFGLLWAASTIWPGAINLMFDGWWTLFIIIPCLCGLFSRNDRTGSAFGLTVGVLLLLEQQTAISWHHFGHLMLAALVVYLGFKLIGRGRSAGPTRQAKAEARQILRDGRTIRTYEVSFGEQHAKLDNETFEGADIECSFGAFRLDLSHAVIPHDVVVSIECSFGAATIIVPSHCGVKVAAKSAFGGIEDKRTLIPQTPDHTIFINGEVSFAGVEIKNETI